MKNKWEIMWPVTVAMAVLISCNIPFSAGGSSDVEMSTSAALTVQAVLDAESAATPLASPTRNIGTATTAPATPTFTQPMASVGDVTNCRSGPGKNYERVTQILPTDPVKIVGFFPPNYWVVSTKDGECWLSGEFTTPSGSFSAIPTVTAPPTPLGGAPEQPTLAKENGWTFYCYFPGKADITISWNDKADNETGYKILRNGEVVAELPVDSTFFGETIDLTPGQSVEYIIRAYNTAGETDSSPVKITCP
ncbi:MAG: SH3 domain-containing protein [Chloroflexi bacterium]|nr:SH3 domain-containing protein [Chloroflexota bacterium]